MSECDHESSIIRGLGPMGPLRHGKKNDVAYINSLLKRRHLG